jgi:hypothetical protein
MELSGFPETTVVSGISLRGFPETTDKFFEEISTYNITKTLDIKGDDYGKAKYS